MNGQLVNQVVLQLQTYLHLMKLKKMHDYDERHGFILDKVKGCCGSTRKCYDIINKSEKN